MRSCPISITARTQTATNVFVEARSTEHPGTHYWTEAGPGLPVPLQCHVPSDKHAQNPCIRQWSARARPKVAPRMLEIIWGSSFPQLLAGLTNPAIKEGTIVLHN